MKLTIDPAIFETYPKVILGVAAVKEIDNTGSNPEIESLLKAAEQSALAKIEGVPLVEHPNIACWREAYRQFGAKPKKYSSSIENLLRRVSSGEQVRHINKLVDIYNVISLRHLLPVGGEDLAQIKGNIVLTFAGESEAPVKLLGEPEARSPYPDEVIYKDEIGTICRRWNWKEADRTKLTEATNNAVIVIEGLPPVGRVEIESALTELSTLVTQFCGGAVKTIMLDKNQPEVLF